MTPVNFDARPSATAPAETVETPVDPPTIKHAGRLSHQHGGEIFGLVLVAIVAALIASGAMIHAILASHHLHSRGLALNGAAGFAVLVILVGLMFASGSPGWQDVLFMVLPLATAWLFLAILASILGAASRPLVRTKPRS